MQQIKPELLDRLSEPERRQLQDALSTIADLLQSE